MSSFRAPAPDARNVATVGANAATDFNADVVAADVNNNIIAAVVNPDAAPAVVAADAAVVIGGARATGTQPRGAIFYAVCGREPNGNALLGVVKNDWGRVYAATYKVMHSFCTSASSDFAACVLLGTHFRNLPRTSNQALFFGVAGPDFRSARLLPDCPVARSIAGIVVDAQERKLDFNIVQEWELVECEEHLAHIPPNYFTDLAASLLSTGATRQRGPSSESATGAAPPQPAAYEPFAPPPTARSKNNKSPYYAVSIGRVRGIFKTWIGGADSAVTGFSGAKFCSFKDLSDAVAFAGVPLFFDFFGAPARTIERRVPVATPPAAPTVTWWGSSALMPLLHRSGLLAAAASLQHVSPADPSVDEDARVKADFIVKDEPAVKLESVVDPVGPSPVHQHADAAASVVVVEELVTATPLPPAAGFTTSSLGLPPPLASPPSFSASSLVAGPPAADAATPSENVAPVVKTEVVSGSDELVVSRTRLYLAVDALVDDEPAAVALPPPAHPHTAPLVPLSANVDASPALPTPLAQDTSSPSSSQEPAHFVLRANGEEVVVCAMSAADLIARAIESRPTSRVASSIELFYGLPDDSHFCRLLVAGQRLPAAGTTFLVRTTSLVSAQNSPLRLPVPEPAPPQPPAPIPRPRDSHCPTTAAQAVPTPTPMRPDGTRILSSSVSSSSSTDNELGIATSTSSSPGVSDDDDFSDDCGGADDGALRDLLPLPPVVPVLTSTVAETTLLQIGQTLRSKRDDAPAGENPNGDEERDLDFSKLVAAAAAYRTSRTTTPGVSAPSPGAQSLVMPAPRSAVTSAPSASSAASLVVVVAAPPAAAAAAAAAVHSTVSPTPKSVSVAADDQSRGAVVVTRAQPAAAAGAPRSPASDGKFHCMPCVRSFATLDGLECHERTAAHNTSAPAKRTQQSRGDQWQTSSAVSKKKRHVDAPAAASVRVVAAPSPRPPVKSVVVVVAKTVAALTGNTAITIASALIAAVAAGALARRRLSLERKEQSRARDTSSSSSSSAAALPASSSSSSASSASSTPATPLPVPAPPQQFAPTPPTPPVSGPVTPLPNAGPGQSGPPSPVPPPTPPSVPAPAAAGAPRAPRPAPPAGAPPAAAAAAAPTSHMIPLENAEDPSDTSVRTKQEDGHHNDVLRMVSACNKNGPNGMLKQVRFVLARDDTDGASHNPIIMRLVFGTVSQEHDVISVRNDMRGSIFRVSPYNVLEAKHIESNTDLHTEWPVFPSCDPTKTWTYLAMTNDAASMEVRAAKSPRWRPAAFTDRDAVSIKLHRLVPKNFVPSFRAAVAKHLRTGPEGWSYAQIRNGATAANYRESIDLRANIFNAFLNVPKSMLRDLVGSAKQRVGYSFLAAQMTSPQEQITIVVRNKPPVDEDMLLNMTVDERAAALIAECDEKAVRGATKAAASGMIGRAANVLKQKSLPDDLTPEQCVTGLKNLHPRNVSGVHVISNIVANAQRERERRGIVGQLPSEVLLSGSDLFRPRLFDPPDPLSVRKFVAAGRRGAAPGGSGWTEEVLHQLLQSDVAIEDICAMLADIANNELRADVRRRLVASDLIALPKPQPSDFKPGDEKKVRPIALCEVILKLACRLVIDAESPALAKFFGDLQFGNRPLGVEICVHAAREQLRAFADAERAEPDSEPSVLILEDFANAFNTIDRVAMYEAIQRANTPMLTRLFEVEYATESLLRIKGAAGQSITSAVGSRQGSTPAGIYFAAGMHPALVASQSVPGAVTRAFFDDTIIAGKLSPALLAFNKGRAVAEARGLMLNRSKCIVLCSNPRALIRKYPAFVEQLGIPATKYVNVTTYLGASVGTTNAIEKEHLNRTVASGGSREFERVQMMANVCGCAVMKKSLLSRGAYMLRVHHPSVSLEAAQLLDNKAKKVVSAWTKCTNIPEPARVCMHLPVNLGGLGITELQQIAPSAYTASVESCRQAVTRAKGDAAAPAKRLQQQLTRASNQELVKWHNEAYPGSKEHLLRNSEPQTGAFITDTTQYSPSSSSYFIAALTHRAGIVPDNTSATLKCPGCPLVFNNVDWLNHAPRCVKVHGYNATMVHHSIASYVRRLCVSHGVPVESGEPRMLWHFICPGCKVEFTDRLRDVHTASCKPFNDKRCSAPICHGPDILVHMADPADPRSTSIVLDVTVVSILTDTAKKTSIDQALAMRTAKKTKDYTEAAAQMGAALIVFDVSELGRPGPGAQHFISLVAQRSGADYHELLRQVASFTALAHGHAIVNAQRLAGIACGSNIPHAVFRANGISNGTTSSALVSQLGTDMAIRAAPWPADIASAIFAADAAAAQAQSLNLAEATDAAAGVAAQASSLPTGGLPGSASAARPSFSSNVSTPGASSSTPPPPLSPAPAQPGAAGATASGAGPVRPPFSIAHLGAAVRALDLPNTINLCELKQHLSQAKPVISFESDADGRNATFFFECFANAYDVVARFNGAVFAGSTLKLQRLLSQQELDEQQQHQQQQQQERLRLLHEEQEMRQQQFAQQRKQVCDDADGRRSNTLNAREHEKQALHAAWSIRCEAIQREEVQRVVAQREEERQRLTAENQQKARDEQKLFFHNQRDFVVRTEDGGRLALYHEHSTAWESLKVTWRDAHSQRCSIQNRHHEHVQANRNAQLNQARALEEEQQSARHQQLLEALQALELAEEAARRTHLKDRTCTTAMLRGNWHLEWNGIAARDAQRMQECAQVYAEDMRIHAVKQEAERKSRTFPMLQLDKNSPRNDAAAPSTPTAAAGGVAAAAAASSSSSPSATTTTTSRPETKASIVQARLSPRSLKAAAAGSHEDVVACSRVRIAGVSYMISRDPKLLHAWHPDKADRIARASAFMASTCVSLHDANITRSWSDFTFWALSKRFELLKPNQVVRRVKEYAASLNATATTTLTDAYQYIIAGAATNERIANELTAATPPASTDRTPTPTSESEELPTLAGTATPKPRCLLGRRIRYDGARTRCNTSEIQSDDSANEDTLAEEQLSPSAHQRKQSLLDSAAPEAGTTRTPPATPARAQSTFDPAAPGACVTPTPTTPATPANTNRNNKKSSDKGAATSTTTTATQQLNSSNPNHQVPTAQTETINLSRSMVTSESASSSSSSSQPPALQSTAQPGPAGGGSHT